MRVCEKHAAEIETSVGEEYSEDFILELIPVVLLNKVDGEEFGYDWYKLERTVERKAGGCPFCFVDGFASEFITKMNLGEYDDLAKTTR
jgi:hypothetical protein